MWCVGSGQYWVSARPRNELTRNRNEAIELNAEFNEQKKLIKNMNERKPILLQNLMCIVLFLVLIGCKKEYITNEHYTLEQADTVIVVNGDTLFIYGDTVLVNNTEAWVMPWSSAGQVIDVQDAAGPWNPSDACVTQAPYALRAPDRVIVLLQFTLRRDGPCPVDWFVNAGVHLGVDHDDIPGSSTAVDVTNSLDIPETWNSQESIKTFTRIGTFIPNSTWQTPIFRPYVRVWSEVCGPLPANMATFLGCSSTIINLPH
jgi:hypothetical protein